MNIVYLLAEDISNETGVVKKIKSKIKIWESMGHNVHVISLASESDISLIDNSTIISIYNKNYSFMKKFIQHYIAIKKLAKVLKNLGTTDIIYTRLIRYSPNLTKTLTKNTKYIIEINTNDVEEFKLGSKLSYYLHIFTRKYFFSNASAFVSVSNELSKDNNFIKFKKKTVVIANGYNFNNRYNVNKIKSDNKKINCVFIGSPNQAWHGLDKIVTLANNCPDMIFHIIGTDKKSLQASIKELPSNLIAYGYLNSEKSIEIIRDCDVGISTLALHRNNMQEASPLKSREYLANGLPIIIGYKDTDLEENEFILNIGNYENNVIDNIDKIYNFCVNSKKISNQKIIDETKSILSYEKKEGKRINFFKEICTC